MNENVEQDFSRQLSLTRKEETVSRRLMLKSALTVGCGVLLPVVLIGCDSKSSNGSKSSSSAAPSGTPGTGANAPAKPAASGTEAKAAAEPVTTGKASQASVQYQLKPKGDQKCSGCALFIEPNACMVVEGEISPEAWCALWAPKAS